MPGGSCPNSVSIISQVSINIASVNNFKEAALACHLDKLVTWN